MIFTYHGITDPPNDSLSERPTDQPTERQTDPPTEWPTERQTDRPDPSTHPSTHRTTHWTKDRPTHPPSERPTERGIDRPNHDHGKMTKLWNELRATFLGFPRISLSKLTQLRRSHRDTFCHPLCQYTNPQSPPITGNLTDQEWTISHAINWATLLIIMETNMVSIWNHHKCLG